MISKSAADRAQVVIGLRGRRDAGVATVRNKRSSAVKLTKKSAEKKESKRWPDAKTTGARESKIVGSDSKRAPAELSLTDAELKLLVEDDLNQFHKFPCTERRIDHTNVLQLLKYHPSARTIDTTELKSLAMSSAVKNESARCGVKDKHAEECLEKKKLSGNQEDDDSSSVVSETSSNSSGTDSDDRDSEARRELVANSRKRVYSFDSPRSAKGGTETLYAAARMSLSPLTLGAALGLEPATPLALPPGIILSRTLSSSKGFINKERKYKDDTESPTQASMSPPVPITIPVETRAGEKHGQPQRHIVLTEAMVEWTLSMIIMRPERFVFDAGKGWKCSGFLLTNDDRICNPLNSLKHRVLPRDREMTVMDWNVIEPDVHWRECALGIPHYFFNLRKLDDSERDLICKLAANSEPRSLAFEIAALAKLGMGYYHGNADAVRRVRKLVHGSRILEQHYKRVGVPKMTEPKLSIGGAGAIAAKNPSVMISRGHDPDAFYEPISTLDMIKKCLWKGRLPGIGDNVQLLYALACGPFWDKDVFAQAAVTGPAATVGIGEGKNATSFRQQGRGHDEVDSKRRESKHMDEELLQSMMVTAVEEDDGDDLLVEQLLQQDMAPESYPGSSDMMTARHGRNVPHRRIVTDRRSSPDRRPRPERQQEADDFWGQSLQGTRSRPRTTLKRRKHALRSANGVVVNKPAGTMMAQIERMDADFNSQATDDLTMLDTDWLALFDLGACKTVVNVADCHERNPDAHVGNLVRLLRGYEPEVVCCVPPLFARQRARAERFDELSFMAQSAFPTENHDDYIKAVTCMTARAVALKWKLDWSSKMKDNLHIVLQSAFWTDYLRSHTAFKTGRELLEEAHVVSPRTIVKNRLAVSWRAADESPVLFGFFVFDWMLGTVAVGGSALGLGGTVPPSKKDVDRTKSISDIVAPDPTSENSGSKISETLVSAVSTSMSVVGTSVETKTKPSGATTALAPSGYRGENSRDLLTDEPIQDFSQYVAYGATNKYWLISFDHLDASLAVETDAKTGLQVVVNPERGLPTKAFEELEKHVLQWIGTKAVAATVSQRKIQISLNGGKWTLDELRMLQGCLLDAGVAHFARRSNLADVIAIMQFKHRYIDSLKPIEKTHCKFVMMRLHDLGWKFRRHQAGKGLPVKADATRSTKDPDKDCIDILAQVHEYLKKEHVAQYLQSFAVSPKNLDAINLYQMLIKLINSEYCIRMASRELLTVTKLGLERDFDILIPIDMSQLDHIADEVETEAPTPTRATPRPRTLAIRGGADGMNVERIVNSLGTGDLPNLARSFMDEPTDVDAMRRRRAIILGLMDRVESVGLLRSTWERLRDILENTFGVRGGTNAEPRGVHPQAQWRQRIRLLLGRIMRHVNEQQEAMTSVQRNLHVERGVPRRIVNTRGEAVRALISDLERSASREVSPAVATPVMLASL